MRFIIFTKAKDLKKALVKEWTLTKYYGAYFVVDKNSINMN